MAHITCNVKTISPLTPTVYEVVLTPESPVEFQAGQYLKVVMSEDDQRPFSIANAPHQQESLVLHIGATPENPYAWEVMQKLQSESSVTVEIPDGSAYVRDSERPILLLAGGTGFSYVHSILLSVLHHNPDKAVTLYWGVRQVEDLYHIDALNALADAHSGFDFRPVIQHPNEQWQGLTGWVHKTVMEQEADLNQYDVYVAGRFEMAKVVRDDFSAAGFPADQLYGDAFSYL